MTQLPFPVHDVADLKRAIRYAERNNQLPSLRRIVIARARQLGHNDLLPISWTKMTTLHASQSLDHQLDVLAAEHGISAVQLKTVYLRGVDDFITGDIAYGSATMYGLARVQRFINERGEVIDTDLVEVDPTAVLDTGIVVSEDEVFLPDVIYAAGERTAALFAPGTVTQILQGTQKLYVFGEISGMEWMYTLDTHSGEHTIEIR